jgi:hypothetical protein
MSWILAPAKRDLHLLCAFHCRTADFSSDILRVWKSVPQQMNPETNVMSIALCLLGHT